MKAKPGEVKVATAGVTSGGHNAMELISRATGVKYRHVTYDGGNPAVVATVSGETDVTTQLAVEQAEMIRGKRIRPLATVSDQAARDRGLRHHRADQQVHPRLQGAGQLLRHLHPQGRAAGGGGHGAADLDREHRQQRGASRTTPRSRGALFAPVAGDAAQTAAMPAIQANAWLLHSTGKTKVAPDTVGIAKP